MENVSIKLNEVQDLNEPQFEFSFANIQVCIDVTIDDKKYELVFQADDDENSEIDIDGAACDDNYYFRNLFSEAEAEGDKNPLRIYRLAKDIAQEAWNTHVRLIIDEKQDDEDGFECLFSPDATFGKGHTFRAIAKADEVKLQCKSPGSEIWRTHSIISKDEFDNFADEVDLYSPYNRTAPLICRLFEGRQMKGTL